MIDLHHHLLPGIDDGAEDLAMALEMARMAVADGIHTVACTPHIYPGLYENTGEGIRAAIAALQAELDAARREVRVNGRTLQAGDTIAIDGTTGEVFVGDVPVVDSPVMTYIARGLDAGRQRDLRGSCRAGQNGHLCFTHDLRGAAQASG